MSEFNKIALIKLLGKIKTVTKEPNQNNLSQTLKYNINVFELDLINALQAEFINPSWSLECFLSFVLGIHFIDDLRSEKNQEVSLLTDVNQKCDLLLTDKKPNKKELDKLPTKTSFVYIRYKEKETAVPTSNAMLSQLYYVDMARKKITLLENMPRDFLSRFDREIKLDKMQFDTPRLLSSDELQRIIYIAYQDLKKRQIELKDITNVINEIEEYYEDIVEYYQLKCQKKNFAEYASPLEWLTLFETSDPFYIDKYIVSGMPSNMVEIVTTRGALLIRCLHYQLGLSTKELADIKNLLDFSLLPQNYIENTPNFLKYDNTVKEFEKNGLYEEDLLDGCSEGKIGCYINLKNEKAPCVYTSYESDRYRTEDSTTYANPFYHKRYCDLERLSKKYIENLKGSKGEISLPSGGFELEVTHLEAKIQLKRILSRKIKNNIQRKELVFVRHEIDQFLNSRVAQVSKQTSKATRLINIAKKVIELAKQDDVSLLNVEGKIIITKKHFCMLMNIVEPIDIATETICDDYLSFAGYKFAPGTGRSEKSQNLFDTLKSKMSK